MRPLLPPLIAGTLAAASAWHWTIYPSFGDPTAAIGFGGSIASMSTTMLGFLMAALAVLASINHTHLVKMMKQYGHYEDLLSTMVIGCVLFLACAVLGYTLLFGVALKPEISICIVALHVAALISLIDVGRKLWLVLANLRNE